MGKSIAVIGGGASAALLLAHLSVRPGAENLVIDVYDRAGRFARGIAYSTRQKCHLLNVRAANMSAYVEDKDHFARWAQARSYAPLDFVPRVLYGQYLEEVMAESARKIHISQIVLDVVSSERADAGYDLTFADGRQKTYDVVVLASGNVRALHPRTAGSIDAYFDDPWNADFSVLRTVQTIALVGSGLTAVDMVLALDAQGYTGDITIFSRNALLPAPHVVPASFASFLTPALETYSPLALLHLIKDTARAAATNNIPWQAVIDSLRAHTNTIWTNWNQRDRARFQARLMTFWNIHRHRMAPQIADTIEALRNSGRLRLVKAGVHSIERGPVVNTTTGDFPFDAVINCLGYRYDEAGRAYEVTDRIGPANFGTLFETTAIPEIRAQAHALAAKILPQ